MLVTMKQRITFILSGVLLLTMLLTTYAVSAPTVNAACQNGGEGVAAGVNLAPENKGDCAKTTSFAFAECDKENVGIGCLVKTGLIIMSALVGIAVVGGIIAGGITYASSQGNPGGVQKGRKIIGNSILGLVAYLLLYASVNFLLPGGVLDGAKLTSTKLPPPRPSQSSTRDSTGSTGNTGSPSTNPGSSIPINTSKPSAANTGVRAGTALTVVNGDTVITRPGIYENMDYRGNVTIRASGVTIRNSRITSSTLAPESGCSTSQARGAQYALAVSSSATNFVLENSEVVIGTSHRKLNGIGGANMTIRNSEIRGGVDGIGIVGNNVMLEGNYIHSLYYHPKDPYQNCTPTHNDGIQIHYGSNITIRNNTISGKPANAPQGNAAIMLNQNGGRTTGNVAITGNWGDYGMCAFNVSQNGGAAIRGLVMTNNKMGKNEQLIGGKPCAIIVDKATLSLNTRNIRGNVWEDGSSPPPTIFSGN